MADPGVFEFGPFRLDPEKSVLWRGADLVPLTPKAFALLRALVDARGDVVSKQELMTRVWPDAAVEDANLSVTVSALRRLIDSQPDGRSWVETVPRRGYRFSGAMRTTSAPPGLSLAVLPFACLGPETEAHLGLGMADALIGRLTAFDGLLVRPTAAVAHYAEAPTPPRDAARELGVDAVVTGTVQRDGERVRLSVQLVPRPAAMRPWAESFDADWTDLFAVQDALAERMALALRPRLTPTSRASAGPRHTPQPKAFEAYMRGRYFWSRFDPENLGKAFAYFGEAAQLDPLYAAPHAGLSDAHLMLGLAGLQPPLDAWTIAAGCAERALAQDAGLAEAHVSRGFARLFSDWDWAGASSAIAHAVALQPGAASVHVWQGLFLMISGDLPGATRTLDEALRIDPLSGAASALRCFVHEIAGEFDQELELARRAVELRPKVFFGHWCMGLASVGLGQKQAGIDALRRAVELMVKGPGMRTQLACALARLAETEAARRELEALDALADNTFVSPCQRAAILLALGDPDGALERIQEGLAVRDAWAVFLGASPLYRALHGDPRFEAILARVGLPHRGR